jgi:hypothetical protein
VTFRDKYASALIKLKQSELGFMAPIPIFMSKDLLGVSFELKGHTIPFDSTY